MVTILIKNFYDSSTFVTTAFDPWALNGFSNVDPGAAKDMNSWEHVDYQVETVAGLFYTALCEVHSCQNALDQQRNHIIDDSEMDESYQFEPVEPWALSSYNSRHGRH